VSDGVVDYPALAEAPSFQKFLDQLREARFTERTTREEKLAFWINAYNALAVAGILEGGSPATLYGRWDFFLRRRHEVAGEAITLLDLERERLLPLGEPRVHFAIVCASASCPALAPEAWRPALLELQLEAAAHRFVNDPARNRFDGKARAAELSELFDWYRADFEAEGGSLEAWLARYVADPDLALSLAAGDFELRFLDWDWSLNGVRP
jgi:hypothetical protein